MGRSDGEIFIPLGRAAVASGRHPRLSGDVRKRNPQIEVWWGASSEVRDLNIDECEMGNAETSDCPNVLRVAPSLGPFARVISRRDRHLDPEGRTRSYVLNRDTEEPAGGGRRRDGRWLSDIRGGVRNEHRAVSLIDLPLRLQQSASANYS
jgi:hypothetical protein